MKIAITGASSNLGRKLISFFINENFEVYGLSRSKIDLKENRFKNIYYEFGQKFDVNFFTKNKIDILILCAFNRDLSSYQKYRKINLDSNLELINNAKNCVKKIFFISSIASFDNCFSKYGKIKLEMEKSFSKDVIIIRPGMFFENNNSKEIKKLEQLICKLKFFPFFLSNKNYIYFTEINEFSEFLAQLIRNNNYEKYIILNPSKIFLKKLIIYLFKKNGIKPFFIPFPPFLIICILIFLEKIYLFKKPISDSLINLIFPVDINKINEFDKIYNKIEFKCDD